MRLIFAPVIIQPTTVAVDELLPRPVNRACIYSVVNQCFTKGFLTVRSEYK